MKLMRHLRGLLIILPVVLLGLAAFFWGQRMLFGSGLSGIGSGYSSINSDWKGFLTCWFSHVGNSRSQLDLDVQEFNVFYRSNIFVINSMKIPEVINFTELENRIEVTLPRSYKDFQSVTGGLGWYGYADGGERVNDGVVRGIYGVHDVDRFGSVDPFHSGFWSGFHRKSSNNEYYKYGYGANQGDYDFDGGLVGRMIKIGEGAQGAVVLLNPFDLTGDGEMEAWVLSPWHGVVRYSSFAALIREMAYRDISGDGGFLVSLGLINDCHCLNKIVVR